ncbi:MAG TPA: Rne/Rng family ribonuclease [Actinomycetota bacterium]|nr:Rne/Rng family ribonuclease [Actinomycetota bacterium]
MPATAEGPAADGTDVSLDDPPKATRRRRRRTSAKPAEPPEVGPAAPESVAGPTRLRRARARTTPGTRRRRETPIAVPRVTDKLMVITEHGERDQIAVLEDRDLVQHFVTRVGARSMVGNVYLGRVQNVLPGMEAAFVDLGRGRNAVLYAGEVNYSPEDLEGTPPRIEQVLKGGQAVLVQVTKDPMGGKGARLTAQISMPGRYLVLVPNANVFGISRRLPDAERRRLKAIVKKAKPDEHGLIVRTAAEGASEEAIAADLARLIAEWESIEKRSKRAKAPSLLYEEPELTVRVVRDLFNDEEFRELVTDSPRVHETVRGYLREVAPDLADKVTLHEGKLPVFEEYHVVEQIHKALDRKVWLPSGGYLIIERTEAMTVIDVNTGKSVGKTNLEATVVGTNLEGAKEVARQLRLRDIGGIIIIDFIDMLLEQNKKKVVDTLKEALAHDKTRSQVFEIGPLGLLEVTRKRVSGGLLESFSETCPQCEGRGFLINYER